jgi:hypothetical protein
VLSKEGIEQIKELIGEKYFKALYPVKGFVSDFLEEFWGA